MESGTRDRIYGVGPELTPGIHLTESTEPYACMLGACYLNELQAHQGELEQRKTELEQALEISLGEYTVLFDFAPVGLITMDSGGHILKSNNAFRALIGFTQPDAVKSRLSRYVVREDRNKFDTFLKKVFLKTSSSKRICELKLLNKSRKTTIVRLEAQPVVVGKKCLMAIIDVTGLRHEEKKFHILADNTCAWEFWIGPDGKFIYLSPSCRRITGYKAANFITDPTLFYRIIHPDDRSSFGTLDNRPGSSKACFEYRIIHRNGSTRWLRHDRQTVIAADGTTLGVRGSNLDVTPERYLKERLINSVKELKKLTAELNLSEERERRRIAVTLHDQVVQSLAIGKLHLDAAMQKGEIAEHPVLLELKSLLKSSMQDLRDLSLDLSSPVLYDMGIKAAIANLGEKLGEKFGFRFVFHPECEPDAALSEELSISIFQFGRELLVNAGKHSGATTVTACLHQKVGQLILNIQDDGKGFNPTDCGGGIGLMNIKQRLHHLGGTFTIQSMVGTGTSAEICIKLQPSDATSKEWFDDNQTAACRRPQNFPRGA